MGAFMKLSTLSTALAVMMVVAPAAQAAPTTFTSTFTQSNLFPSSPAQDHGTLNINCSGTSCSVSLTPTGDTFFGNEFLGFNLASGASGITLSSALTADSASLSTGGSFNLDGFGTFANLIGLPDGPNSGFSSTVSLFTVNYTGDANTLLTLNSGGFDAAGHVLISGTSCTGFVGEGTGTNNGSSNNCGTVTGTPEPRTLSLLGLGLLGLAGLRRRGVI